MKRLLFAGLTTMLVIVIVGLSGEMLVRFLAPQPYLYPRPLYSEEYGHLLNKNTRIVNGIPGGFRFTYTVIEYGYRASGCPTGRNLLRS